MTGQGLPAYGTEILINILDQSGGLPVNNFRDSGTFPNADATSGETLAKTYLVRNKGCMGCNIGCGRIVNVPDGPYKGFGEGPEYEAGGPLVLTAVLMIWQRSSKQTTTVMNWGWTPLPWAALLLAPLSSMKLGLSLKRKPVYR